MPWCLSHHADQPEEFQTWIVLNLSLLIESHLSMTHLLKPLPPLLVFCSHMQPRPRHTHTHQTHLCTLRCPPFPQSAVCWPVIVLRLQTASCFVITEAGGGCCCSIAVQTRHVKNLLHHFRAGDKPSTLSSLNCLSTVLHLTRQERQGSDSCFATSYHFRATQQSCH